MKGLTVSYPQYRPKVIRCCSYKNGTQTDQVIFEQPVKQSQFRQIMHQVTDFICDYYENKLEKLPVRSQVIEAEIIDKLPKEAPQKKEEWCDIWRDFESIIMPGITHWQSPNFFAYYPANSSYASIIGETLSAALNVIGFSWISSPSATELEMVVMDWVARMLQLPSKFLSGKGQGFGGGVIQGSASEATIVAMIAARSKKQLQTSGQKSSQKLVMYTSDQAHSSFQKGCQILDIVEYRLLPTSAESEWALEPQILIDAIQQDIKKGLTPCMLQINVGTTSTAAVDPIAPLVQVCQYYGIWSHVDAAYSGSAAICPEIRGQFFNGIEEVDSFNFNAHKWLLTNFDCSLMWIADSYSLKSALSLTPVFLKAKGNHLDLKDWQIPLGRKFRSLKLWLTIRMYGVEGLQAKIRHDIALAEWFAQKIRDDPQFELVAPQRFGLVCFKVRNQSNQFNKEFLEKLNESGKIFMIHTSVGGVYTIRLALGGTNTQIQHVQNAWNLIRKTAYQMISEQNGSVAMNTHVN